VSDDHTRRVRLFDAVLDEDTAMGNSWLGSMLIVARHLSADDRDRVLDFARKLAEGR
jgi:hypothetical protein